MPDLHLEIEGMTCEHCVRAVHRRLSATPGIEVTNVEVGSADIRHDPSKVSIADIHDAISDEGYTIDTVTEGAR